MGRLVLWLVLGALAWFAWQAWRRAQRAALRRQAQPPQQAVRVVRPPEPIVRCAHCGVHLPASEAVRDGDAVYCGAAHRDARRTPAR